MSFLPFPATTTSEAVALIKQDGGILHEIVHGDENAEVLTENGLVPSVNKVLQDLLDRIGAGTGADVTLRPDLAADTSSILVGGAAASKITITVNNLKLLQTYSLVEGRVYFVTSFYSGWEASGRPNGGGYFIYMPSVPKNTHNGVTVIDPVRVSLWNGTRADLGTLFTSGSTGTGCFVRIFDGRSLYLTWAGADPVGASNSHASIQQISNIAKQGDNIKVDGYFRLSSTLSVNKTLTIEGTESRTGNIPDLNLTSSTLYFDAGSTVGLEIQGAIVTIKGVAIVGTGVGEGIRSHQVNNSITLTGGSVVQNFETGVKLIEGYYNKLSGATITFCKFPLSVDYCYNVTLENFTIRAQGINSQGITLINSSQLNMSGGSIENCTTFGVGVYGGSNANLNGVYFENFGGKNVQLQNNGSVTTIGCHVYLTEGANEFIGLDGAAVGTRVFSRGNRLVLPTDTNTAVVYAPNSSDNTADWDVGSDIWPNAVGANVSYISGTYTGRLGKFKVEFPSNHPSFDKPISTVPLVLIPSNTAYSGTPLTCTMMSWSGSGSGDPAGVGATAWGNSPYMAVYQKGQWEKVGLKLPNQSNSSASTVAALVTDFNSLLQKLRDAGVMI